MSESLILVPLDGTPAARTALPVAKALADILDASLHLIHVSSDTPLPLTRLVDRLGLEQARLHGWSIGARVGEPSAMIVDEAQTTDAFLIVMCTHTTADRPQALLGHTALDVLCHAPCPVVLVSPSRELEDDWRPSRILLPYDGSPTSNAAIVPAAKLALRSGAEMLVVQVGSAEIKCTDRGSLAMPCYVDQPQHEWPSWTGELLKRLASLCPGGELRARLHVCGGDPAAQIVKLAAEQSAGLIVLAWKGEWAGDHARTLKAIVRDASCPIMIVPPRGDCAV